METEAIALVVDEPIAGHFYWVLQKRAGAECRPIAAAEGPMPSYGAAMMAGIAALQRRADTRDNQAAIPVISAYIAPAAPDAGPPTIH